MCMYKDCEKEVYDRGVCHKHYDLYKMFVGKTLSWSGLELMGLVNPETPTEVRCIVEGCASIRRAKGLCSNHYQQARYGGKQINKMLPESPKCEVCSKPARMIEGRQLVNQRGSVVCASCWQKEFEANRPKA